MTQAELNLHNTEIRPLPEKKSTSPFRHLLANRDFRLLWIGEAISLLGDQFHMIALPWLVLQMTGDAFMMGAVLAGLRLLRPMSARTVGLITGMTGLTHLLIDEVARPEMFHMGIPVINFLMFFGVGFAYGILWELAMSRLLGRLPHWKFAVKRNAER